MRTLKSFPPVSCRYGAPMGRASVRPETDKPVKLRLTRARWVDYDYDAGGAYWGQSGNTSIYCGHNRAGVRLYVRAESKREAARKILEECPDKSTCGGLILVNGEAVDKATRDAQRRLCADRLAWLDDELRKARNG